MTPRDETPASIPLRAALLTFGVLIAALAIVVIWLPRLYPSFHGSGHLPLIVACCAAAIIGRRYGFRWDQLERAIVRSIALAMPSVLVLIVVGMLIGAWMVSGVVPALIFWGLRLLHPSFFLPAACLVCSVVSIVSGSSWSTAGTVGPALSAVGSALGVRPAFTGGAIVSGAYFGDKLSPLSETTNLAPAVAEVPLFTHIRHMLHSSLPAWGLALAGYALLSISVGQSGTPPSAFEFRQLIDQAFNPGLAHLLPPLITVGLILLRQPALPTLIAGTAAGCLLAGLSQGASLAQIVNSCLGGYDAATGNQALDNLLSRGGMFSMGETILLILVAMALGGILERTGMIQVVAGRLLGNTRSPTRLVATTVLSAISTNVLTAEQYMSIVLPGRMYAPAYDAAGLPRKNLSRALEDGGTMSSALVPWATCGAFMSTVLLVPTMDYAPYAFFNWLSPIMSIALAALGYSLGRGETTATKGNT